MPSFRHRFRRIHIGPIAAGNFDLGPRLGFGHAFLAAVLAALILLAFEVVFLGHRASSLLECNDSQ
jgi:hypothetical protein